MANSTTKKKPELLAPAGSFEKLKIAVHYGADAVYLGGDKFSLRTRANNFSIPLMKEGIEYAHNHNVRVYIAINSFFHNDDLNSIIPYLEEIQNLSPDAVIASDPGLICLLKKKLTHVPIHLSTQANTTNWETCEFWKNFGVTRAGLARELSFEEIKETRKKVDMELEMFIHGAMCISYSGRCWMSKYITKRDANRGDCAQVCRWKFYMMEEKRPREFFPVEEDEKGGYFYNSKDLCLIKYIPQLIETGVNSFKIEGRMKSINYLATILNIYRQAIDKYWENPGEYSFDPLWMEELNKVSNRDYTNGFFINKPTINSQNQKTSTSERLYKFLGIIINLQDNNNAEVLVKNKLIIEENIEIFSREKMSFPAKIGKIITSKGESTNLAQPNDIVTIQFNSPVKKYDLIRKHI